MEEEVGQVLEEIRKILKKKKEENEALGRLIRALHDDGQKPEDLPVTKPLPQYPKSKI